MRSAGSRQRRLLGAWVLAMVCLVEAGCGFGNASTNSPPPPKSALDQVTDRIQGDGTFDKDTALQAFALTIGALPGVNPPNGPDSHLAVGGGPIRWVFDKWSEISAEQKSAILKALRMDPATGLPTAGLQLNGRPIELADATSDQAKPKFQGFVNDARSFIRGHLGRDIDVKDIPVVIDTTQVHSPTEGAYLVAAGPGIFTQASCTMHITPYGVAHGGEDKFIKSVVAHEVFHCFQRAVRSPNASALVIEGQAAWVGESYAGGSSASQEWWKSWLTELDYPLQKRKYDGVGFYSHLAESGTDPWSKFDGMLKAADVNAAIQASGALAPAYGDTEAASAARDSGLGASWQASGPGITGDRPQPEALRIGNGVADVRFAKAGTRRLLQLDLQAELFQMAIEPPTGPGPGFGLMHNGDGKDRHLGDINMTTYCTGSQCSCPQDSDLAGMKFEHVPGGQTPLALSGVGGDVFVSVTGSSLDDYCHSRKPTPPPAPSDGTALNAVWKPDSIALTTHVSFTGLGGGTYNYITYRPHRTCHDWATGKWDVFPQRYHLSFGIPDPLTNIMVDPTPPRLLPGVNFLGYGNGYAFGVIEWPGPGTHDIDGSTLGDWRGTEFRGQAMNIGGHVWDVPAHSGTVTGDQFGSGHMAFSGAYMSPYEEPIGLIPGFEHAIDDTWIPGGSATATWSCRDRK